MAVTGKAQSSMEYMVLISALIIVFIGLQVYMFTKMNETGVTEGRARLREVCDSLSSQFTLAGYSKNFSGSFRVPLSRDATQLDVAVYDETIVVDYNGQSCVSTYRAGAMMFNGTAPPFTLTSGSYWISNSGGVVTIAPQ